MPFHNEFYNEGSAGFIDFVWLWYNRLSVIIFLVSIVILVLSTLYANAKVQEAREVEGFVRGTNFRNLSRDRHRNIRQN